MDIAPATVSLPSPTLLGKILDGRQARLIHCALAHRDCVYAPQQIVNAAWTPLYIAGGKGRDVELIYQWHPWLFGEFPGQLSWWQVPPARYSSVIGAEMAVWQTSPQDTVRLLEPRVPTMMERAWAPQGGRGFAGFLVRMNHTRDLLHCLYGAIPPPPPTPTPGGTYQP